MTPTSAPPGSDDCDAAILTDAHLDQPVLCGSEGIGLANVSASPGQSPEPLREQPEVYGPVLQTVDTAKDQSAAERAATITHMGVSLLGWARQSTTE